MSDCTHVQIKAFNYLENSQQASGHSAPAAELSNRAPPSTKTKPEVSSHEDMSDTDNHLLCATCKGKRSTSDVTWTCFSERRPRKRLDCEPTWNVNKYQTLQENKQKPWTILCFLIFFPSNNTAVVLSPIIKGETMFLPVCKISLTNGWVLMKLLGSDHWMYGT